MPLAFCRLPRACNLTQLVTRNLTGPGEDRLQNGTCGNQTSLPHGGSCDLHCPPQTAAELPSNPWRAIDRTVRCFDGDIRAPPQGTICSTAAWELPSVVFLGVCTL